LYGSERSHLSSPQGEPSSPNIPPNIPPPPPPPAARAGTGKRAGLKMVRVARVVMIERHPLYYPWPPIWCVQEASWF
jgi:hypothetical protein